MGVRVRLEVVVKGEAAMAAEAMAVVRAEVAMVEARVAAEMVVETVSVARVAAERVAARVGVGRVEMHRRQNRTGIDIHVLQDACTTTDWHSWSPGESGPQLDRSRSRLALPPHHPFLP